MKYHLVIENDEGTVFESSAESFDLLSDKFFAFVRHNGHLIAEDPE